MANRLHVVATLLVALSLLSAAPANAAGEILITHSKALAGNVTPGDPAGYPVIISTPGTFQLASNLFVPANRIGIQLTTKNVTIDLNGFTLEGSDLAWHGIVGGVNSVTVKNGTITRFKFDGINAGGGWYWTIQNARIIANGRNGIYNPGAFNRVETSTIASNVGDGISCGPSCYVEGNTVSSNGFGITIFSGIVLNNTMVSNISAALTATGVGLGNNAIIANNGGSFQIIGTPNNLHPNFCSPVAC
jgi:parallel beta-helix repeat protein